MKKLESSGDLEKLCNNLKKTIETKNKTEKTISISYGTSGIASGATEVKKAFEEGLSKLNLKVSIETVGSIGMDFLELIVIIHPEELFYCRVTVDDVDEIIEQTLTRGEIIERLLYEDPTTGKHIRNYQDIPYFSSQYRIILENCGLIDPEQIEGYIANNGYAAAAKALTGMTPDEVIQVISDSKLRGRGGAGFSTGLKWSFAQKAAGDIKYVICNSDEGDPGAFMDRCVGEGDPHAVLEGLLISGYAIGAQKGYIYCRAEYPLAVKHFRLAIEHAKEYGLLGENILNTGKNFDIEVMEGAGAFVCGEETALIASIEGKRGEPRPRPPFPANSGLWGKPTNINNVKTLASVPRIILNGADWFAKMGTDKSNGTTVFALAGDVNNSGLVEIPLGRTLGEIIYDIGGGVVKGKKLKAVQIGGPLGGCLPAKFLNTPVDYESITATGAIMGSGGMIVADEDTCMIELARFFLEFAVNESCGTCIPCRVGGKQLLDILKRITRGEGKLEDLKMIKEISEVMQKASLCNLGQLTPNPILTTLMYYEDEYLAHIIDKRCPSGICEALSPSPCQSACPAEVNIPLYISYIAEGEYEKALDIHREVNPFPAVCGRVCPAFCEKRCRRGKLDKPVAIRSLKRFMTEQESQPWEPPVLEEEKNQSIAVLGGGPAGLTAALRLAQHGYNITIFEAMPKLGGMMAYGIPDYRLQKDLLQKEIKSVTSLDKIEVRTNTRIGKDIAYAELREKYDAVLLAVGTQFSREIGIAGEDNKGVIHGIELLKKLNAGDDPGYLKDKRAVVLGGGNVAIDAARSLVRLGAAEVTIAYRRQRENMPAISEEIEEAEKEGVKFEFLLTPIEIISSNDKVTGLHCQRMSLINEDGCPVFDRSGRKTPFPIKSDEITIDTDLVVPAIGQQTDFSFLEKSSSKIESDLGTIAIDKRTFLTNDEGVFAAGDVASGPATVVQAIAQGNKAAKVIQRYLNKEKELMPPAEILQRPTEGVGKFEIAEEDGIRPRQEQLYLSPELRKDNFKEVELGFSSEAVAQAEARRCLRCDLEPIEED